MGILFNLTYLPRCQCHAQQKRPAMYDVKRYTVSPPANWVLLLSWPWRGRVRRAGAADDTGDVYGIRSPDTAPAAARQAPDPTGRPGPRAARPRAGDRRRRPARGSTTGQSRQRSCVYARLGISLGRQRFSRHQTITSAGSDSGSAIHPVPFRFTASIRGPDRHATADSATNALVPHNNITSINISNARCALAALACYLNTTTAASTSIGHADAWRLRLQTRRNVSESRTHAHAPGLQRFDAAGDACCPAIVNAEAGLLLRLGDDAISRETAEVTSATTADTSE